MIPASIDLVPSPEALAHSQRLVGRIGVAIDAGGGWLPFDRFMAMALYEPGLGYYTGGSTKFGAAGDFVTAPELSPLFGRTLAREIAAVLRQTGGDVLELGPGTGRLALQILTALDALDCLPDRYRLLDVSGELRERQSRLLWDGVPHLASRIEWLDALPETLRGVVLGNEVLDAIPVHLIAWRDDGPHERGVIRDDAGFSWAERSPTDRALVAAAAAIDIDPPYDSEIGLQATALVATLARRLDAGTLLFIDYGFGRNEFYHPQRRRGTLMCHYRHRVHDDPFLLPGLQDITAHVDFTAIAQAGVDAGLDVLGYTTQAHYLVNAGITALLEAADPSEPGRYLPLAAGVQKLLSPAEMGELFKVIALGRGMKSPLGGFVTGDLSRLL